MLSLLATLAVLPPITEAAHICILDYWTGCYAWPSVLHVTCKDGFVPTAANAAYEGSHKCGFLGEKGRCAWDGETTYDYGCGCNEGTECMKQDCELGNWEPWTDCTAGCTPSNIPVTTGTQSRTRPIVTPAAYGGAECLGVDEERVCTSHECSKDCEVGAWGAWSTCNKVCGVGGRQYRSRSITQPMVGYGQPCQPLSDMRTCNETPCFWYTLTGRTGQEEVEVIDGNDRHEFKLSTPQTLGTTRQITIDFKNDKGDRDVWFNFRNAATASGDSSLNWVTTGEIVHQTKWSGWKCGSSNESKSCKDVRAGYLKWGGKYTVTFDGSVVTGPWSSGP